jgi:hypothetical protein
MMTRPTNAAARLQLRNAYIPKGARPILEHDNGSALYVYEMASRFCVIAFWGTAAKSHIHETYRTEAQRDARILDWKAGVEASVSFRAKMAAERKAAVNALKVGDIVNTSWGYDQTNVEFYVVTRATKSSVWVRRVKADGEATGYMCGRTWPAMPLEMVGEETMHRASGTSTSIDGHHASLTTGDTYESSYA